MDFLGYSPSQILAELGHRFKAYRVHLKKTQKEASQWCCVSVTTIHLFETGKLTNMDFHTLYALMRFIGQERSFDLLIPDLTEALHILNDEEKIKRVRHGKKASATPA